MVVLCRHSSNQLQQVASCTKQHLPIGPKPVVLCERVLKCTPSVTPAHIQLFYSNCCQVNKIPWVFQVSGNPVYRSVCVSWWLPVKNQIILFYDPAVLLHSVLWRCWLGGRKGIRPEKNWVVGCWHGCLSGARCRLAYGPADATATPCLLLQ